MAELAASFLRMGAAAKPFRLFRTPGARGATVGSRRVLALSRRAAPANASSETACDAWYRGFGAEAVARFLPVRKVPRPPAGFIAGG